MSSAGHCWSSSVRVCTMPLVEEELELAVEVLEEVRDDELVLVVVGEAEEEEED